MTKFTSWSPTRLSDYEQCPAMAKWKHLVKLCPICFKGRVTGGFDSPAVCDTCGKTIVKAPALERGTIIGKGMEDYLVGKVLMAPVEVASKVSRTVASKVRKAVLAKTAKIEFQIVLNKDWKPVKPFDPAAWLRAKLDVLVFEPKNKVKVIDWKTGGVDKATEAPRVDPKYDDQLSIYSTAALSAFQAVQVSTAELVFLDAKVDPVVARPSGTVTRAKLAEEQAKWSRRLLPMLNDDVFAPCPTSKCRWCDFSSSKGGPCQF